MRRAGLLLVAALIVGAACSSDGDRPTGVASSTTAPASVGTAVSTTTVPSSARVLLAVHDGRLDAMAMTPPFSSQTVLAARSTDAQGVAASGPVCLDPVDDRLVGIGVGGAAPGVAILEVHGHGLGDLRGQVRAVRSTLSGYTVSGCAFLADGRLVVAEHDTTGLSRITVWPAALNDTGAPCVVDRELVAASDVTTLGGEFVVAASARTRPFPGLYAYELAPGSCKLLSLRLAAQLGAVGTIGPTAVTTFANRVWAGTGAAKIVSTPAIAGGPVRSTPAVAAFVNVSVHGIATVGSAIIYVTTQGTATRSGVLWQLTITAQRTLARPMATAWSGPGGVVVYVAPGR